MQMTVLCTREEGDVTVRGSYLESETNDCKGEKVFITQLF